MFKFSTGLVVLSLLAAAPALAQAPATAPATPAKPIVNTVKDTAKGAVDATKGAVDATKDKVNATKDAVTDKTKGAVEATKDKATEKAQQATHAPLIDINTASVETLATLHGIGPVRAEAIVKGRPYKGKDDLVEKKIVPENVYKDIKELIIAKQK